jgi:hypothetical protein
LAIEHAIARERAPAAQRIDDLAGAVVRVLGERQVDLAVVPREMPVHHGHVLLADDALLEGEAHAAQHLRAAREQHQTGGGGVEPVHDAGVGPARLDPRRQTIVPAFPARGDGEEAGGLVDDEEELVDEQDGWAGFGRHGGTGLRERPRGIHQEKTGARAPVCTTVQRVGRDRCAAHGVGQNTLKG